MALVALKDRPADRDRPETIISPSILSADFANLARDCDLVVRAGADWLHVDIMDGHFVGNLTIGPPVVKCLRKATKACLDCHLMVSEPAKWVKDMSSAGADNYIFHIEHFMPTPAPLAPHPDALKLIASIRDAGMNPGMAIKPGTDIAEVYSYIEAGLRLVLVLTVEPGFGGQSFKSDIVGKCKLLRDKYPDLYITVDGGVAPQTIDQVAAAGANVIVAGSAIFGADDYTEMISGLRSSVDKAAKLA